MCNSCAVQRGLTPSSQCKVIPRTSIRRRVYSTTLLYCIMLNGVRKRVIIVGMSDNFKLMVVLLCVAAAMVTTSCGKENSSEYYVKYEAEHFSGDTWYYRLVEYSTPEGIAQAYTYDGDTFTAYAGPFHKGDYVQIKLYLKSRDRSWMAISVKENGSPFVVKKSVVDSVQIGYLI